MSNITHAYSNFKQHRWLLLPIARFGANWPSQSLQKGPKLKIPLRLQFQMTVSVNDFIPHKWLFWSLEFNETVKTSLLLSWRVRPFWC